MPLLHSCILYNKLIINYTFINLYNKVYTFINHFLPFSFVMKKHKNLSKTQKPQQHILDIWDFYLTPTRSVTLTPTAPTHIYTLTHTPTFTRSHIHTPTFTRSHIHTPTYLCVYYTHTHTHTHICRYTHTPTHLHTHTPTYTHTHPHTYPHTYTHRYTVTQHRSSSDQYMTTPTISYDIGGGGAKSRSHIRISDNPCDDLYATRNSTLLLQQQHQGHQLLFTISQRFCESKNVHSLSKLCIYFNIVLTPTTRWIHIYYFKLNLILLIHKVIKLIIRLIYF